MPIAVGLNKFAPGSMKRVQLILKSSAFIATLVVILSVSFVTQQVYAFENQKLVLEQKDDSSSDSETIPHFEASKAAINSVVHVELAQGYHQIMEIRFESKDDPVPTNEITKFDSGHYRTLFRQVISPNAP